MHNLPQLLYIGDVRLLGYVYNAARILVLIVFLVFADFSSWSLRKEFFVQDKELIDPKIGKIKGTTPDTFW